MMASQGRLQREDDICQRRCSWPDAQEQERQPWEASSPAEATRTVGSSVSDCVGRGRDMPLKARHEEGLERSERPSSEGSGLIWGQ